VIKSSIFGHDKPEREHNVELVSPRKLPQLLKIDVRQICPATKDKQVVNATFEAFRGSLSQARFESTGCVTDGSVGHYRVAVLAWKFPVAKHTNINIT
jgi:hypothetical protein